MSTTEENTPSGPRIEKIGRRWYAFDWPKDQNALLRERGTWDPERRGWWTAKEANASRWYTRLDLIKVEIENGKREIEEAHAAGVCTWTRMGIGGGQWFVTGPEHILKLGIVMLAQRGKPPQEVRVENARKVGNYWIADKVEEKKPRQGRATPTCEAISVNLKVSDSGVTVTGEENGA